MPQKENIARIAKLPYLKYELKNMFVKAQYEVTMGPCGIFSKHIDNNLVGQRPLCREKNGSTNHISGAGESATIFVFVYFYICICVFVYVCICI